MKAHRWLLAAVLTVLLTAVSTAALDRPYADNQRNWLLITAALALLALVAVLWAAPLVSGFRACAGAILGEWRTREQGRDAGPRRRGRRRHGG